ncbi:hypothetical protein [Arthrobacter sp. BPSS-3]|uniref:hypothetical protein n=1 Tax=Arthrobacter sp. BPSS-3 TaxID=3366580 RepID=UPI0037DD72C9
MSTTSEYLQELNHLSRDYRISVEEASAHTSEFLTAEGLRDRREKMIAQANFTHAAKLRQLQARMDTAAYRIQSRAQEALPKAPASTRDSWERVKMLLDAGQSLAQVIGKADAQSLHAIREWAPTWLDATSKGNTTDLAPFERSIAERWAELVPNAEPIREYIDSAPDVATFNQMAESFGNRLEGRESSFGSLSDAFAATYAGQQAKVNLASLES